MKSRKVLRTWPQEPSTFTGWVEEDRTARKPGKGWSEWDREKQKRTMTRRKERGRPLASRGAQMVKNLPAVKETWVRSLGWEDPWRRERQPIPVFLPGESHGQRSLVGIVQGDAKSQTQLRDWTELMNWDMTEWLILYKEKERPFSYCKDPSVTAKGPNRDLAGGADHYWCHFQE